MRLGMPYYKYLQSESWFATRDRVKAARPVCECCGLYTTDQVHHLTYERVGNELDDDLLAVCRPCHAGLHAKWGEIIGMGGDKLVTQVVFAIFNWRNGKATQDATRLTIIHREDCAHAQA